VINHKIFMSQLTVKYDMFLSKASKVAMPTECNDSRCESSGRDAIVSTIYLANSLY
jgi:hypothetical protein